MVGPLPLWRVDGAGVPMHLIDSRFRPPLSDCVEEDPKMFIA
jgi:hypothetical protein